MLLKFEVARQDTALLLWSEMKQHEHFKIIVAKIITVISIITVLLKCAGTQKVVRSTVPGFCHVFLLKKNKLMLHAAPAFGRLKFG